MLRKQSQIQPVKLGDIIFYVLQLLTWFKVVVRFILNMNKTYGIGNADGLTFKIPLPPSFLRGGDQEGTFNIASS